MTTENATIIRPYRSFYESFDLKKLWKSRDLLVALALRDIKIRHKQTILGVAWVIFQPLLSTVIFTLLFGLIIKLPSNDLPYPVFVFVGLSFWNFFSTSITSASGSLIGNESLIKKVYFPRVILPIATIATNFFDFLISVGFMIILMFFYHQVPNPYILILFPISLMIVLLSTIGISLFLAAANAKYRDIRVILPFFIQMLIFVTPVIYPTTIVSQSHRWILALNPLSTPIEMNRMLLNGQNYTPDLNFWISFLSSIVIFIIGLIYFSKMEKSFADII